MTFKLPGTPSPHSTAYELADYAEWVCWRDDTSSVTQLLKDLGRLAENDYSDGVPEEEPINQVVEEAFSEIERRVEACRGGYPFALGNEGYTLLPNGNGEPGKEIIYKYLLLATRLNMTRNRRHADMDGTSLFESLAAEAGQSYFGARSQVLIFGTSAKGPGFSTKIDALCEQMLEGGGFVNRDEVPPDEQDGGLDVVVWKPFADKLPGKLIGFGQCKTGTHYRNTLTSLQPSSFCDNWLHTAPTVPPVRMFFVAEALPRYNWNSTARKAGLIFDRCRIVDYSDDISAEILEKVAVWTAAAHAHLLDA